MVTQRNLNYIFVILVATLFCFNLVSACSPEALVCSTDKVYFSTLGNASEGADLNPTNYYITILSPIEDYNYSNDFTIEIQSNLPNVWFTYNGMNITYMGSPHLVTYDNGTHVLEVYATDSDGNLYQESVTFKVNVPGDSDEDDDSDDSDSSSKRSSKRKSKTYEVEPTYDNPIYLNEKTTNTILTGRVTLGDSNLSSEDFNWNSFWFVILIILLIIGIISLGLLIVYVIREPQDSAYSRTDEVLYDNVY